MKRILLFVCAMILCQTAFAEQKMAVVSLQRALNEVNEGKKAKATIQAEFNVKKKQLDSMKDEIQKMRDGIEAQKMVLSKEALEAKGLELQNKAMEWQKKLVQYEQELKQKESESVQKILLSLRDMVIAIAKEQKFDIVYENSSENVLYAASATDLTPDLIKKYNAKP